MPNTPHPLTGQVPTVFHSTVFVDLGPTHIREYLRSRLNALETAKLGAVAELLEAEAVFAEAPNTHPGKTSKNPVEATNLTTHIENLRAQVGEYDLRIAALIRAAEAVTQPAAPDGADD